MKSLVRFALSLLISVVLFAVFAFIAFSGLFDYIESRFYDERIEALERQYVQKAILVLDRFHEENLNRFGLLLQNSVMVSIYDANRSREQIGTIRNIFELLKIDYSDFLGVRFIDPDGFIHFSTFEEDIQTSTQLVREYKRLIPAEDDFNLDQLSASDQTPAAVLIDAGTDAGNFVYKLKTTGGTALFYVSSQSLVPALIQGGILDLGARYSLIHGQGIILKLESGIVTDLERRVQELWEAGRGLEQFQQVAETESSATLIMYAEESPLSGKVGSLINEDRLVFSLGLKILLLASFFLTSFLIVFLLLSIRQDRVLVLSERIKRFQIGFLKGYVDKREEINWEVWKRDLNSRKEEIRKNIKKGIGKLKSDRAAEVDALIDKSWNEVLDVIGARIEAAPAPQLEVSNLEDVIRRVVSDKSLLSAVTNEAAKSAVPRTISVPVQEAASQAVDEMEVVEDLEEVEELEEFEDLEEVGEEETDAAVGAGLEAAPEVVEEPEALEEFEEVEELEEFEDLEEVGEEETDAAVGAGLEAAPEVVEEPEALEEFEEVEELEEFEDLEEVGEEETDAAVGAGLEAAPEVVEEPEALEEFEEVEELEEFEDLEEVGEEETDAAVGAGLEAAPEVVEEPEALEEFEEVEELEEFEDLEEVGEEETDAAVGAGLEAAPEVVEEPEALEEFEEVEELEEFEDLEEVGEEETDAAVGAGLEAAPEVVEEPEALEEFEEVEELELEEAPEAAEEPEAVEEFEEVEELELEEELEVVEEPEAVEEFEEVEELELEEAPEAAEEPEAVEEFEEVEELELEEELEVVEEPEAVEEFEEVEELELEEAPEAAEEPEAVEEFEEVEELELEEELEVVEEPEAVEEFEEVEELELEEAPEAAEEPEAVEEFEEVEELELEEELEAVEEPEAVEEFEEVEELELEEAPEAAEEPGAVEELKEVEELELEEEPEAVEEFEEVEELELEETLEAVEEPEAVEELELDVTTGVVEDTEAAAIAAEDISALPEIETREDTWELITEEEYQKLKAGESSGSIDDVLVLPEIDALVKSISDEIGEFDGALEEIPDSEEEAHEEPEDHAQALSDEIGEATESVGTFLPAEIEPHVAEVTSEDASPDEVELESPEEILESVGPAELDLPVETDEDEMYLYAEQGDDEEVDYSRFYDEDIESEDGPFVDEAITEFGDADAEQELGELKEEETSSDVDELEVYVELDDIEMEESAVSEAAVVDFGESEQLEDDEIVLVGEKSDSSDLGAAIAAETELETDFVTELEEMARFDDSVSSDIADVIEAVSEISPIEDVPQPVAGSIAEVAPLSQDEEIVISVEGHLGSLVEVAPLSKELPEPVKSYIVDSAETEEESISISISRLPDEFYEQLEELELVSDRQYRDFSLEQISVGYPMLSRAFDYQRPPQSLPPLDDEAEQDQPSIDIQSSKEIKTIGSETKASAQPPDRQKDPLSQKLAALIDSGDVEMYTISELKKAFGQQIEPVEFKEGVFQVSDKAFDSEQPQADSDRQLSELVDAVISEDDEEVVGIDTLFSSASSDLDLSLDFLPGEISEESEDEPARRKQMEPILAEDGLDFDKHIVGGGLSSLKELKALIRVSHVFNALTAAILVQGEEGLYIEHGIGLEESESRKLCLNNTSSLYEIVFSKRYFIAVKKKMTGIPSLDTIFKDENTRYFNASLYLPIIFRGEPAYLFLGLKDANVDFISCLKDKLLALENWYNLPRFQYMCIVADRATASVLRSAV